MPNYARDDPGYWQVPERFEPITAAVPDARLGYFLMGPDHEDTPTAVIFEMDPGFIIPRHAHESERFEVIVRGSLDVGDRILHVGDVMTAREGEFYGPKVAGPEGCTTVEVFSTRRGAEATLYELVDGSQVRRDLLVGEPRPDGIVGMAEAEERRAALLGNHERVDPSART
jgi:hypothetical protein